MFANRKKTPAIQLSKLSSLIAEDVVIVGDISFSGGLRIDGRVKGNVVALPSAEGGPRGLLVLSDKGQVEGSIRCGDAVINGAVTGDVDVENFLELQSNARMSGTIRYQHLKMDVGAAVQGRLSRAGETPAPDNVVELTGEKAAASAERR
jgi:cytoskeletal protein CcmA (bactofilin family)